MFEKILSLDVNSLSVKIRLFGLKINIKTKFKPNKNIYKIPIENNKIFLKTFSSTYSCNPKYIAEEILKQKLPYKLVWGIKEEAKADFPKDIKTVVYGTKEYLHELASSKVIIRNDRSVDDIENGIIKKEGQIYIQTWHGSLGIKKTGIDINNSNGKAILSHRMDAESIDYLVSNSKFTDVLFKNIFFGNGKILKVGHPRNDIFFVDSRSLKEHFCEKYNISIDTKIVMYAPTFRDKKYDLNIYSVDTEKLKQSMEYKFGGEWIVLVRLHPKLKKIKDDFIKNNSNCLIDVTDYSDMQELLAISDSVITDYSSCIYDFILTHRPAFIYATDIKEYNAKRGFYYPLESTPFPVAKNNDELIENIRNFDDKKYTNEVDEFLKEKGCIDAGHASEEVVGFIKSIVLPKEVNL